MIDMTSIKSRISFFLPEDCIKTASGLTTRGIKGTSTTAANSAIADSTKDALLRADWLLEKRAWQGVLMNGIR